MKKRYNINLMMLGRLRDGLRAFLLLIMTTAFLSVSAQERTVSGQIVDGDTGEPVPGVTVLIKGTTRGTVTDFDGNYKLGVSEGDVLQVSFIGYKQQQVTVGAQSVIDFKLALDVEQLEEVVVIGYGAVQKKDLTGSVAPVSAKDFNKGVLTSPSKLITGKVAGVQVSPSSGEPGAAVKITIRGAAKVGNNGSSDDPLYVIDGVAIDNTSNTGGRDPLSFINPSDIENITVLKDASATAIYGSRGAHGVIIITTKGGNFNQKASFSYSGNYTISQNLDGIGNLSPENFEKIMRLKGGLRLDMLGDSRTDWVDEVLQDAVGQSHSVSVSGGTENNSYRVGIGYQDLEGVMRKSGQQRSNISFNFTQKLFNDDLTVSLTNKSSFIKDQYSQNVIGSAFSFDPTQAIKDPSSPYGGYFEWDDTQVTRNPVAQLELTQEEGKAFRSLGNVEFEYKFPFISGLSAKVNLAYDVAQGQRRKFIPDYLVSQVEGNGKPAGFYELENYSRTSFLSEYYATYKKDLASINSSIEIVGGYSYQTFQSESPKYIVYGLATNDYGLKNPAPDKDSQYEVGLYPNENRLISFFGRMNYSFQDKYLLTASFRRDGSTRFATSNQWGFFPSAAFKWQLIDEPFLADQSFFDDLGVRVGYGQTGNQEIRNYAYVSTYSLSTQQAAYQFGDEYVLTWRPSSSNPVVKWETMSSVNIGIDYGFMNGRMTGSVDLYQKKSNDLLNEIPLPAGLIPADVAIKNIGSIVNSGIEIVLSSVVVDKPDLNVSLSLNATHNRNEVKQLDDREDPSGFRGYQTGSISGDIGQQIQILKVGEEINSFEVYEHIMINGLPADDRKDWNGDGVTNQLDMYVDRNNDGIINELDRRPYKSPFPDWMFGLTGSARYKQFDVSFTFRSNIGNYVYNNNASQYGNVQHLINRVPNNVHESLLETNFNSRQLISDYYVENASFLKLDNISVGYNINIKEAASLRVYSTFSNIFTITGYSGQDPESGSNGIDNNLYPFSRTMLFGVSLNF